MVAVGVVTAALWTSAVTAASAEDLPPVEPPPAVETPPAEAPPPPPPVQEPAPPPPVTAPPPAFDPALAAAEFEAATKAFQNQYGAAIQGYLTSRPGAQVHYNFSTGVFTDENGNPVDLAGYASPDYVWVDADAYGTGPVPGLSEEATVQELEAIVEEPAMYLPRLVNEIAQPVTQPTLYPAPPVVPEENSGGTVAAITGWMMVAAYALWRRRFRAIELLKKAK